MASVRACSTSDVPPGSMKFVSVSGVDLVIANVDGKFYALDNWCTHEQGDLSQGELRKNIVTCPEHSAQFDVTTGRVVTGPEGEPAESISAKEPYKIQVQGKDIMVELP